MQAPSVTPLVTRTPVAAVAMAPARTLLEGTVAATPAAAMVGATVAPTAVVIAAAGTAGVIAEAGTAEVMVAAMGAMVAGTGIGDRQWHANARSE